MSRLPEITDAALTDDQKRVHAMIAAGPRGTVRGPLRAWLHSPPLAERAQELGAFCRYHSSLPPRLSELTIIITAAHWRAIYEWQVHAPIALKAGIDAGVVEAIRTSKTPVFAQKDEKAIYAFATELLQTRRVSDATYAQAEALLGHRTVMDLVGVLGYYGLISMTINAFELAGVDDTDPFA